MFVFSSPLFEEFHVVCENLLSYAHTTSRFVHCLQKEKNQLLESSLPVAGASRANKDYLADTPALVFFCTYHGLPYSREDLSIPLVISRNLRNHSLYAYTHGTPYATHTLTIWKQVASLALQRCERLGPNWWWTYLVLIWVRSKSKLQKTSPKSSRMIVFLKLVRKLRNGMPSGRGGQTERLLFLSAKWNIFRKHAIFDWWQQVGGCAGMHLDAQAAENKSQGQTSSMLMVSFSPL